MTIAVRTPQAHEFPAAARLLFGQLPESEQGERSDAMLAALASGEISAEGILIAEQQGVLVGAILSALQPDKTAFVWPPEVRESSDSQLVADALLQALARRLDERGAWLGQCILQIDDARDRAALSRNGFPHLTDLHYLENRSLANRLSEIQRTENLGRRFRRFDSMSSPPAPNLDSEPYDFSRNHRRFVEMLERTYVETFDCPEISGSRTADEALESHRLSGDFEPARWKLYRTDGCDVGVLLMNDHPEQDAWEITYLGVAREYRGRGYGLAMIERGCSEARAAGRSSVLVAVDCRNQVAKTIYEAAGFVEFAVRAVHVRVCPDRARAL
ncbi:MAG: GNAT family N-acetyltransferase [Planctomycetaceae bacterium]